MRNDPEEHRSHLLRAGSLQSHVSPTELFSVKWAITAKVSHCTLAVNWPGTADVSMVNTTLFIVSPPHSFKPRNDWQSLTGTQIGAMSYLQDIDLGASKSGAAMASLLNEK
jgi:hypothetical protein